MKEPEHMDPDTPCLILAAAGSIKEAETISRALVEERLAACCTVLPAARSTYRWEGRIMQDDESLIFVKSTLARYGEIEQRIRTLHSYMLPEILCIPVACGFESYVSWLQKAVTPAEAAGAAGAREPHP
jgi:periplasmic divalent cation tolerance protein